MSVRRRSVVALFGVAGLLVASAVLGSGEAKSGTALSALDGRWSLVETCPDAIAALQKAGLAAIAPSVVGGYFPNSTPQELAAKPDICSGASPMMHSHFFTKLGKFGSLDQNGQQVDNGHNRILSHHRLRINNGTFHYRVVNGKQLHLAPIITAAMRAKALASPLDFSVAGWEVAVSYTGQTWKRIRCGTWCWR